jgi:hypothetical protein
MVAGLRRTAIAETLLETVLGVPPVGRQIRLGLPQNCQSVALGLFVEAGEFRIVVSAAQDFEKPRICPVSA